MPVCSVCGKEFSVKGIGSHVWRMHGEGRSFSPSLGRPAWNKGLTKETSYSVKKNGEAHRRKKFDFELDLDDDGKLIQKWRNKCVNAKFAGLKCKLTYEEYCSLVRKAGLKSSQLGYSGERYVLSRFNDEGDYTIDNCRFIRQKDNVKERKRSEKMIECSKKTGELLKQRYIDNPELRKEASIRSKKAISASPYFQDKIAKSKLKKEERAKTLDTRYTGEHNSQTGTYWITDGITSKKWKDGKGEIPEGFHKGRIFNIGKIDN